MPQMSPLMWLTLFMFFMTMMSLMINKTYFNFNQSKKNETQLMTHTHKKLAWTW